MDDDVLIRQLAEAIGAVFWLADANKPQILYVSNAYDRLWGRDHERLYHHYDEFFESIHPDDRERVRSASARCVLQEKFEIEYRIVRPDGEVRWIRDRGFLIRDQAGAPHQLAGFAEDVTQTKHDEVAHQQTAARLQASHDTFRHLVENSPFGVYIVDADFRLAQVSAGAQKVFASVRPLIGRDFAEVLRLIWPEPFATEAISLFRHTLATGEPYHSPSTVERRYDIGEVESYDWKIERITLPDGRFGVVCHFYDLSERQRYEAAVRESEERFRDMADNAPMMIWVTDATGYCTYLSKSWYDFTGQTEVTGLGFGWLEATHPDDRAASEAIFLAANDRQEAFQLEYRLRHRNGFYRTCIDAAKPWFGAEGEFKGYIGSVIDIHDRKQAEAALHQSSAILNTINQATPTLIYVKDRQGRLQMANPSVIRAIGKPESEIIGHTDAEFYLNPDEAQVVMANDRQVLETGQMQVLEEIVELPEGRRTFLSTKSPYPDEAGNIIGLVGVSFDITDRKQAEAALRDREQRLTLATKAAQLGVFEWKIPEDIAIWENDRVYEIFRHTPADGTVSSQDFFENYLHPDDLPAFTAQLSEAMQTGTLRQVTGRMRRKDGTTIWIELNGQFEFAADGSPLRLIGVVADITDRKHTEQVVAADLKDMQRLHDLSTRLIFEDDVQVLFDEILAVAIAITQANAGTIQLLDPQTNQLVILATQGIEPSVVDHFRRVDASSGTPCGIALGTGERSCVDFDAPGVPDPDGSLQIHVDAGLLSAQSTPLITRLGKAIGMLSTHWNHHRRPTERELRFLDLLTRQAADLIERRQTEAALQAATAEAQQRAQEAEAANRIKDEFLAVLSHELRSPLNPILGWSKLLQQGKLDATRTTTALDIIERNAQLQAQLINDLLDISRILRGKLSLEQASVDLSRVIASALETVRLAAEAKGIDLRFEPTHPPTHPPPHPSIQVMGDAGRLQQVVWNLLSNAVKFTPEGGQVEIRLSLVIGHSSTVGTRHEARGTSQSTNPGQMADYAQIQVIDTGKGINPEFLPYVFEHFRQEDGATTRKFGGLGLGLAIARQIVEMHGGQISVDSPGEGQGTTFTVRLPLLGSRGEGEIGRGGDGEMLSTQHSALSILLAGLHILVVDDEPDSRDFIAFVLEQAGAIVTNVASGIEALQAVEQSIPDLIVSDIGMPEMDGYMLLQQIRMMEKAQSVPAIALTAYAGECDRQQALEAGFQCHLTKPVEPVDIVTTIARLYGRKEMRDLKI